MNTKLKEHINSMKEFLTHNLNLNYINKDTTVEELLVYLNRIENNYIPMMKKIEGNIIKNK